MNEFLAGFAVIGGCIVVLCLLAVLIGEFVSGGWK